MAEQLVVASNMWLRKVLAKQATETEELMSEEGGGRANH